MSYVQIIFPLIILLVPKVERLHQVKDKEFHLCFIKVYLVFTKYTRNTHLHYVACVEKNKYLWRCLPDRKRFGPVVCSNRFFSKIHQFTKCIHASQIYFVSYLQLQCAKNLPLCSPHHICIFMRAAQTIWGFFYVMPCWLYPKKEVYLNLI